MSAGASGIMGTEQVMRLNSLYDPNFTGTGHQPYGFDQLAALYNYYKVVAVRVTLTFTDPASDGLVVVSQIQPSGVATALTSATQDACAERQGAAIKYLNNTGSQVARFSALLDIGHIEGLTPSQFNADISQYSSLVSANPSLTPWLRYAVGDINGAANSCKVKCELEFHVEMWERTTLSQS